MKHVRAGLCLFLTLIIGGALCAKNARAYTADDYLYTRSEALSEGQVNIVKRARQLFEVQWTPILDRYAWDCTDTFSSGTTYTGVPYGQPVNAIYIGFQAGILDFVKATEDSESLFYTSYSRYNTTAPYYSTDCSGFVSYAWGLETRATTRSLPEVAQRLDEQNIDALEVGDCLDNVSSHALLITGVVRDEQGAVVTLETMEQTPNIVQKKLYGAGGTATLEYFEQRYLKSGYKIYRYDLRDDVLYEHSCAVPIDGDYCTECQDSAPRATVHSGPQSKTVTLSHNADSVIYYTLDGREPTTADERYTQPLEFFDNATLKAIAVSGNFSGSRVLTCTVSIPTAADPVYTLKTGMSDGLSVSVGSTVALSSDTAEAQLYYTLDGSEPTVDSRLYTGPITIREDTTVQVMAVAEGFRPSQTVRFDFVTVPFSIFSDVDAGAWYYAAVDYVSSMGLFNGVDEGIFSPDGTMTRGMFVTVLGRVAGVAGIDATNIGLVTGDGVNLRSGPGLSEPVVTTVRAGQILSVTEQAGDWYGVELSGQAGYISSDYLRAYNDYFSDLSSSTYYAPYVRWVYLAGISSGDGTGVFHAEENISRQDMTLMLYRYAQLSGKALPEVQTSSTFTDEGLMGSQVKEAVYALNRAGIISGMGDGTFAPEGSATRAQVAQIFMNFLYAEG